MGLESGLRPGLVHFLHDKSGGSFSECALLASLATVVCLIGLLALRKAT